MPRLPFTLSAFALLALLFVAPQAADAQRDGPFHQDPGHGCFGHPDDPFCDDDSGTQTVYCTGQPYYGGCAQCYARTDPDTGVRCVGCQTPTEPGSYPDRCTFVSGSCVESGAYCVIAFT